MTAKTQSDPCALCAAHGIETYGAEHAIQRDADRDGVGHSRVYACDDCYREVIAHDTRHAEDGAE